VIITLTTDFGTADGYAGAIKGVIASRAPGAAVVDITHDIARHDIAAAAYALAVAAPEFPPATIHLAVVDPGVGSGRQSVVLSANGQRFVGPDNGVFELVAPEPDSVHEICDPRFRAAEPSATFHGRDVFATAAAALANGLTASDAGPEVELSGALLSTPRSVVHLDRFGNLITDVAGDELGDWVGIRIAGTTVRVARTYADVEPGGLLAYVGSAGTVEIAAREGSAAERLGVERGEAVELVVTDD
jgi:hypothetical protein